MLSHFSEESRAYAAKVLDGRGVELKLGVGVKEIVAGYVVLSDDTKILSRMVVWAGGLKAADLAGNLGLYQGHGGRIEVQADSLFPVFRASMPLEMWPTTCRKRWTNASTTCIGCSAEWCWASKNILLLIQGNQTCLLSTMTRALWR